MKNPVKFAKKKIARTVKGIHQETKACIRRTKVSVLKAQNKFMGDALDTMVKANQKLANENAELRAKIKSSST